jgi:peptidoglycan/xylan/chitin deacetylase (PgdA/CDA1 family)
MCHGINWQPRPRKIRRLVNLLTAERFEAYFRIAAELGFHSISYDQLAAWKRGVADLPDRPIMFDFDHPEGTTGRVIAPIMRRYGYTGNLFINTSRMQKVDNPYYLKWDEIGRLMEAGWHIGAHTHHHYRLDYLAKKDPSGGLIREELETCDAMLRTHLGVVAKDFAYTTTTWSRLAEDEVKKRYRFGRLWIIGAHYHTEAGEVRYADLVGVPGPDELDGGPPNAARYITEESDPYRLPSMELECLIFQYAAFRAYLQGALAGSDASLVGA